MIERGQSAASTQRSRRLGTNGAEPADPFPSGQSVIAVRPVIVRDGSTDKTDQVVRSSGERHPGIALLRRRRTTGPNGGAKAGYESLKSLVDLAGNLDGDTTLPNYNEPLVGRSLRRIYRREQLDTPAADHRFDVLRCA